ncbi:hypothetical protein WJX81_003717 [Elliptochloris bilobata]|uniref:Essential protein Yae1 N-terminal domain-containing protein n=1 Tax=Elliptochloris bilobata TaxID=381761 RepID=A0AAW1R3L7_9CHLO
MGDFDAALHLEEQHQAEGQADGYRDGAAAGLREGRELGIRTGFDVADEVAFYDGCTKVWRRQQHAAPEAFPARAGKSIAAIEELVAGYPLGNPQDERLQDLIDELRAKFKVATAALGLREHYSLAQPTPRATFLDF